MLQFSQIKYQMEDFCQKLKALGGKITQDTINLENTRLANKYLIFDLLAVGKHSTLYYGIEQATGKERIFKFYNLRQLQNSRSFKEKQLCKRLSNYKYSLAMKCSSIHVLTSYDIYEDRNGKIIVSEYCNLRSLADEITISKNKGIEKLKAIAILKQIVNGLSHIHKQCGIIHKNLKAKNILIQDGIYKLIDFGLPDLDSQEQQQESVRVPEIIMKKPYDQKAEVWNVGLLFHQMIFGQLPRSVAYGSPNTLISSEVKCLLQPNEKNYMDIDVHSFLQNCLQTQPKNRMTWKQLIQHPIFLSLISPPPKNISHKQDYNTDRMSVVIDISENYEPPKDLSQIQVQLNEDFYQKKFNLQQQAKNIEKQLEQSYQKLGQYLDMKSLEPASWQPLRKKVNRRQNLQYQQLKNYYLQCLKVDFVFYDMILVITGLFKKNQQDREFTQFLYLLLSRCFFQISQLQVITQTGKFDTRAQSILIACIKRQTSTLYTAVKKNWEYICGRMQDIENEISSIFFDAFKKISNGDEFKRKDQLLVGIEGPDFSKEEQIAFTMKMYAKHIRPFLNSHKDKDTTSLLIKFMDRYEQMWSILRLEEHFLSIRDKILHQIEKH